MEFCEFFYDVDTWKVTNVFNEFIGGFGSQTYLITFGNMSRVRWCINTEATLKQTMSICWYIEHHSAQQYW